MLRASKTRMDVPCCNLLYLEAGAFASALLVVSQALVDDYQSSDPQKGLSHCPVCISKLSSYFLCCTIFSGVYYHRLVVNF